MVESEFAGVEQQQVNPMTTTTALSAVTAWLGLRWLQLSQILGQAKAMNLGSALAWPGLGPSLYM
jgi:hypothetical protein